MGDSVYVLLCETTHCTRPGKLQFTNVHQWSNNKTLGKIYKGSSLFSFCPFCIEKCKNGHPLSILFFYNRNSTYNSILVLLESKLFE